MPESFLNKFADLSLQLHLKRESVTGFSLRIFAKFLRTTFLQNTSWRMLLYGPCIIFTTLRGIGGVLINKYLARRTVLPMFVFQI